MQQPVFLANFVADIADSSVAETSVHHPLMPFHLLRLLNHEVRFVQFTVAVPSMGLHFILHFMSKHPTLFLNRKPPGAVEQHKFDSVTTDGLLPICAYSQGLNPKILQPGEQPPQVPITSCKDILCALPCHVV
jgi:hypothetical protein